MKPWFAWMALTLPLAAAAQDVWRCGPEGRSYSAQACPGGRRVEVPEPRPAADVQAAHEAARREMRWAETSRRERLAEEAALRGNGLAAFGPAADRADASLRPQVAARKRQRLQHAGPADDGTLRAVVQASRRTRD